MGKPEPRAGPDQFGARVSAISYRDLASAELPHRGSKVEPGGRIGATPEVRLRRNRVIARRSGECRFTQPIAAAQA